MRIHSPYPASWALAQRIGYLYSEGEIIYLADTPFERLLDIQQAGDEQAIRQTLNEWHQYLSPEPIWADYQARLAEVMAWPVSQQFQCGVHGKQFFPSVVHESLTRLLGEQAKANDRQNRLLQSAQPPADLRHLWQKMGLL